MGAIIRYTSKPMALPDTAQAQILGNHTYYADTAPSVLYVNFSNRNSSLHTVRQYDLGPTVNEPASESEPPLEKTVWSLVSKFVHSVAML